MPTKLQSGVKGIEGKVDEKPDKYLKEYISINKNKEGKYIFLRAEQFRFGMQDGHEKNPNNNSIEPFIIADVNGKKAKVPVCEKCMILYYMGFKFVMKKEVFKKLYRRA